MQVLLIGDGGSDLLTSPALRNFRFPPKANWPGDLPRTRINSPDMRRSTVLPNALRSFLPAPDCRQSDRQPDHFSTFEEEAASPLP
jgi:hypothetical protein